MPVDGIPMDYNGYYIIINYYNGLPMVLMPVDTYGNSIEPLKNT